MRPTPTSPWLTKIVDPKVVVTEPGAVVTLGALNCARTIVGAAANAAQATSLNNRFDVIDSMDA
jgi:hypothetical protein